MSAQLSVCVERIDLASSALIPVHSGFGSIEWAMFPASSRYKPSHSPKTVLEAAQPSPVLALHRTRHGSSIERVLFETVPSIDALSGVRHIVAIIKRTQYIWPYEER